MWTGDARSTTSLHLWPNRTVFAVRNRLPPPDTRAGTVIAASLCSICQESGATNDQRVYNLIYSVIIGSNDRPGVMWNGYISCCHVTSSSCGAESVTTEQHTGRNLYCRFTRSSILLEVWSNERPVVRWTGYIKLTLEAKSK